jgi:peptidoglycan-associated lipoprotein
MFFKAVKYLLLFASIITFAGCSVAGRLKKADKKYNIGEYYAAAPLYKRVMPRIPAKQKWKRAEISMKIGNCYRLINENAKAEAAYSVAIKSRVEDSICYLYYADVLLKNEKYKNARVYYQRYLEFDPTNDMALNGLVSCDKALEWRKNPTPYVVKKESPLNSTRGDFCPTVGNDDGSLVYFTSSRNNAATGTKKSAITGIRNNDIFYIKKNQSGKWESPMPMDESVNTIYDEGVTTISADFRTMYFTRARSVQGASMGAEIYSMQHSGGEWTTPQIIKIVPDSSITVAHATISPNGEELFFVSDMPGGFGGKDIWKSVKKSDGDWDTPVNLGKEINTFGDEMFPSFRADGTLYFSSNGHPGLGGLDIYKATRTIDKETKQESWTVENMLSPINSSGDDFGISFIGKSEKGYFSSNRKEAKGYDKIYNFEIPVLDFTVSGKIVDTDGTPLSDAIVRIIGEDGTNAKIRVKKDGSFSYKLNKDVNYIMQASSRGFLNEKNSVSTVGLTATKKFTTDFNLPSVGKPVKVDNVFYETGKYVLTKDSEKALRGTLVKMLKDNPHTTIEIGAHTDMVGSEESNNLLSERRAQAVVDFLIREGIDKDRLTAKGYGESKPIVVDEALATQYNFFTEGDVLNEEYVSALPKKQQEIANQINRRTEFTVLSTTYKMY